MALPSFILAPGSNELEKWSWVRNNEASWLRKEDSGSCLAVQWGRQGGKEGGTRCPFPTGTHVPMSQRKGKKHFCISLERGRKPGMKICEIHNTVSEQ